jgi:hypothetical protein
MFMGKKWAIGCSKGASVIVSLIPAVKFMIYRDGKKIWEFHL